MVRWKHSLSLLIIVFLLAGQTCLAEKKKRRKSKRVEGEYIIETRADGTKVKYKKRNVYDFEGTDIEGLFKRPSGSYISNLKGVKGRSIIHIRKNFDAEVVDSVRLVK